MLWWHRYLLQNAANATSIFPSRTSVLPTSGAASEGHVDPGSLPFKFFALILLVIALAGPQIRHTYQIEQNRGMDIMLTLDTSGSMGSIDFKTKNRLEVAKEVIANFIEKRSPTGWAWSSLPPRPYQMPADRRP